VWTRGQMNRRGAGVVRSHQKDEALAIWFSSKLELHNRVWTNPSFTHHPLNSIFDSPYDIAIIVLRERSCSVVAVDSDS